MIEPAKRYPNKLFVIRQPGDTKVAHVRVISMVPSWTETLVSCGVNVIARTRFCIEPRQAVKGLPVVGGTKDINWAKVNKLKPDLLIFDKEENPVEMAEASPFPWVATHVQSVFDLSANLQILAGRLHNDGLSELAEKWDQVLQLEFRSEALNSLLGERSPSFSLLAPCAYLIWHNPYMTITDGTFIASLLKLFGVHIYQIQNQGKYPAIVLEQIPENVQLLLSTEPFPFHKKLAMLQKEWSMPHREWAVIDGQLLSWFGLRSLRFLLDAASRAST